MNGFTILAWILPNWISLPSSRIADQGNCQLLGPFSVLVQLALGATAVSSLVVKRYRESNRRPLKVWCFDVLKQIFGAIGLHFFNLLASILFSSADEPGVDDNPCTWYFLNVLLDTTIGVPLLWFFLYVVHTVAFRLHMKNIVSGEYGHPPRWSVFFKQAALYMIAMMGMKIMLYVFVWWTPFLDDLGAFLISWTQFDPRVQVCFVVLVFPLIMNSLQYYLIDSIIEAPEYGSHEDSSSGAASQKLLPSFLGVNYRTIDQDAEALSSDNCGSDSEVCSANNMTVQQGERSRCSDSECLARASGRGRSIAPPAGSIGSATSSSVSSSLGSRSSSSECA